MKCAECGAEWPGEDGCRERFHELLAAEVNSVEAQRMHGLTVLTYHTQHPSLTKPWYQVTAYEGMRRIFGEGRAGDDWLQIMRYEWTQSSVKKIKAAGPAEMPPDIRTEPVEGEMTIANIEPSTPPDFEEKVLAWARSVARGRAGA
jgi:hypothetical protein